MIAQAKARALPFSPVRFGTWWGTDPTTRSQDDVDVVAASPKARTALLGECKWRESVDETQAVEKLHARSSLFKDYKEFWYALFTKNEASCATREKYADGRHLFVSASDLYGDEEQ